MDFLFGKMLSEQSEVALIYIVLFVLLSIRIGLFIDAVIGDHKLFSVIRERWDSMYCLILPLGMLGTQIGLSQISADGDVVHKLLNGLPIIIQTTAIAIFVILTSYLLDAIEPKSTPLEAEVC